MSSKPALAVGLMITLVTAPVAAQELDPGLGVEAIAVLEDGRLLVRNGQSTFDCILSATTTAVELADCRPRVVADGDTAAILATLSHEEWEALVRDTLLDAQCRLSAFGAVADIVARAAEANGVAPNAIERERADLSDRAEAAVTRMLRAGMLSYRDGELALDDCP